MNKYVEEVKMLTLPDFNSDEDSIGHITVEGFKDVPFEIKGFFIFSVKKTLAWCEVGMLIENRNLFCLIFQEKVKSK